MNFTSLYEHLVDLFGDVLNEGLTQDPYIKHINYIKTLSSHLKSLVKV
jgi:hypothetical protein